jgi:AhpD family alkylhydroperoxidase
MTARIDTAALAPAAYKAMVALDNRVHQTTIPKPLLELMKLRASQINGCAYCVDLHSHDAKEAGEPGERIFAVAAWAEGPFFSEAERAALALTEAMTRLGEGGGRVSDEVWEQATKHYDEQRLAELVMVIAAVNAWNRIGVATRMVPESYRS